MSEGYSCVEFLQRLIRIPSLPGSEGELADAVKAEMETLAYDRVYRDDAGNIVGLVRGQGHVPSMMFNTHLDHVDVGDPEHWAHPPFGGELENDKVWGRGAVDIKGPLAAQIHGVARLTQQGIRPPGDVYVTAVVQEEVGGLGARHLITHLSPSLVVVGEPSSNGIRRGHRGRTELVLHVIGRSVHASVPESGINPLDVIAHFLLELRKLEMPADRDLGTSSVAPTLIRTDQTSANVVPGEAWLTCDWRNIPGESGEEVRRLLQRVAERCAAKGAKVEVKIPTFQLESYTGFVDSIPANNPAFLLQAQHPAVRAAQTTLGDALGRTVGVDVWRFATDGGHFSEAGMTVVGFGPGDEMLAHTNRESIGVDDLEEAVVGNEALALEWVTKVTLASRQGG